MYSKFACFNIGYKYSSVIDSFPEYNIEEQKLIITNILDYMVCYLDNNNNFLKILVFLKEKFVEFIFLYSTP